MNTNNFIKAFIAGMTFPAIALPISYMMLYFYQGIQIANIEPIPLSPIYTPLFFGTANVVFIRFYKKYQQNIMILY